MQNRPYIRSRSSKIINFGANRKRVYTFLLVTDVKKTYQFKTNCKDDVMISLHKKTTKSLGYP